VKTTHHNPEVEETRSIDAQKRGGLSLPEVSIGLPVYNGARHLEEAVESLLRQTFSDFELIISDNASTDDTGKICKALASRDERIRYVRQPRNIGAVRNFDFVAHAARGTFLKWASANDWCPPTMLEKCVDVLRRDEGTVLCYGRTCLVDGRGSEIGLYQYDLSLEHESPVARFIELRSRMNLNNAQHGLIRLRTLRRTRLGRLYPDGDLIFMAELALYGKFRLLPEVLLYRRMDAGAATRFLSEDELSVFLDPDCGRKRFIAWRRHCDCFWSVMRSPIPWPEKLKALDFGLRSIYWDRRLLWRDILTGFRPRRYGSDARVPSAVRPRRNVQPGKG
jgi:glycosyltransferase involved in cell wall biosynthesis